MLSQGACIPCAAEFRGNPSGVRYFLSGLFHCQLQLQIWEVALQLSLLQWAVPSPLSAPRKESVVVGDGFVGWEGVCSGG